MNESVLDQVQSEQETDSRPDLANSHNQDFGINCRQLPEQLKKTIVKVFSTCQAQEKFQRRQEIMQDCRHRWYDMGVQHIYMNQSFEFVQAQPGGTYGTGPNAIAFGSYIDDYDIFHPFALIQQAKLSENMPGIDFQPVNPNDPDDVEASGAAEGMRHDFDRNNDVKEIQKSIIYHLQMGGRAVQWTWMADEGEDFGDQGNRRRVRSKIYGCIEAKVPIFESDQQNFPYAILYDDPYITTAKTKYEWIADKLAAGQACLNENAYERVARLGILQGIQGAQYGFRVGDSISHLIGRGHGWFRLAAFQEETDPFDGDPETVPDKDGGSRQINVKEKIAQIFPNGVHVCVVGKEYAEAWNQSMDDCINVGHAFIGKGQSRMPIMKSMVVVQDRFNTSMNYVAETNDFGVGSTWVSCSGQEYATIKKQKAAPGAFRQMKELPAGQRIQDLIFQEKAIEIPSTFQSYIEFLVGALPQFQLAVPPSIWGQQMPDQTTAHGYALAASQAMGILGSFWTVETQMLARMYYHNCLAIKAEPDYPEEITVPTEDGKNQTIRKASLEKGNFRAYPDTESGFPESTAAKRQTLTGLVTQLAESPLAAQIFGSPDNVAFITRQFGVPELVIPEAEAREKQLREIETLLAGSPKLAPPLVQMLQAGGTVPDILNGIKSALAEQEQAQQTEHAGQVIAAQTIGGPAPPPPMPIDPATIARSSVPVWESDYHVWEAKKCRDWLSSDDRHTEETIGRPAPGDSMPVPNIAGILNVVLHMKEHDAYAAMEAPPISGPLPAPNMGKVATPQLGLPPGSPSAGAPAVQ